MWYNSTIISQKSTVHWLGVFAQSETITETKEIVKENPKTEIVNNPTTSEHKNDNQLKPVFDNYYALKNALIKSDNKTTSVKPSILHPLHSSHIS